MFSKYFEGLEKKLLKKTRAPKSDACKTGSEKKSGTKSKIDNIGLLIDNLKKMIPSNLEIGQYNIMDPSGYSPEGIDFIVYKEFCNDIANIMGGKIPCELVYAAFHVSPLLDKDSLNTILRQVVQAKKVNRYTEREEEPDLIPSFIIAYDTDFNFADIKTVLIENYMSMSIDNTCEVDIVLILNKGLIVKNWREKRSYIALETGKDTLMWFFILMNEYIEGEKSGNFDLRNYVQHGEKYNEY